MLLAPPSSGFHWRKLIQIWPFCVVELINNSVCFPLKCTMSFNLEYKFCIFLFCTTTHCAHFKHLRSNNSFARAIFTLPFTDGDFIMEKLWQMTADFCRFFFSWKRFAYTGLCVNIVINQTVIYIMADWKCSKMSQFHPHVKLKNKFWKYFIKVKSGWSF